ncbi:MAG: DNA adenine methylase [Acidithiobacillus caldus]|nr:DNA adenine methylase [Acidithiobacillus caldus]
MAAASNVIFMQTKESPVPELSGVVPAFPWMGGKGWLAEKIRHQMPRNVCYVEAFAGAAAMLLALPPAPVEILNDRNDGLVNFYRVLQNHQWRKDLIERLEWTPYSRTEYALLLVRCQELERKHRDCGLTTTERQEWAWAFFYVANATFSGGGQTGLTDKRFATSTDRSQGRRARYHLDGLPKLAQRLRHVVIENLPALYILAKYDSDHTLFFLDPPYYPDTRAILHEKSRGTYEGGEMDAVQHHELLAICRRLRGMVALCGYAHPDYDDALLPHGWKTLSFPRKALSSLHRDKERASREERVWLNPPLAEHFARNRQVSLF